MLDVHDDDEDREECDDDGYLPRCGALEDEIAVAKEFLSEHIIDRCSPTCTHPKPPPPFTLMEHAQAALSSFDKSVVHLSFGCILLTLPYSLIQSPRARR